MFDIGDPFVSYTINVTVQQMDFTSLSGETIWKSVGFAEIGPERHGDNTNRNNPAKASGPQVNM